MARKSRTYPEAYPADKKSLWHMARNRIAPVPLIRIGSLL